MNRIDLIRIFEEPTLREDIYSKYKYEGMKKAKYIQKQFKYSEIKTDGRVVDKDVFIIQKIWE